MNVQTKILLLLLLIIAVFVGGLVTFKLTEERKYKAIAERRNVYRTKLFEEFLRVRGDSLKALIDDRTVEDDTAHGIATGDLEWAERSINEEMLASFQVNAVWIYKSDQTLLYSYNNHRTAGLRELPVPPEAFARLFEHSRTCHFFVQVVPQGWMEIRGATVHPSRDRFRETTPAGYMFAGHTWNEDLKRMALFTDYSLDIVPANIASSLPSSAEELGQITFTHAVSGWDGRPVAAFRVEYKSPIIEELNLASKRLFSWLMIFAGSLLLVLSISLIRWVRQPLRLIADNLQCETPAGLEPLRRQRNEFGKLADLILQYRSTEDKLEKAEEELRHSQKLEAVGRLAGGIAHDFNNLLTAIIGYSDLLERRLANDGEGLEQAQLIHKAGEQAAGLTRQLLAFSRKQLLQPKVINLNALVLEMEKLLQRVIGEHIRIHIRIGAEEARVLADANQLEQVILNLGVNARDAMPRGGTLTIATQNTRLSEANARPRGVHMVAGEYVTLMVSDTGAGMDTETKARIFEPFFTTKGPGRGTGLGLATVYGVVTQSGGSISVDSEPGQGSTFTIHLPRTDAPIELPEPTFPVIESAQSHETVLVVEDEEVVRTLVYAILHERGYHVLCAGSPTEALQLVQQHHGPIHLLVSDVVMPEMHGPALARMLKPLQPGMRVLYVSGYSENDISDQGVIDPHLDVLQKPFTHDVLTRKVRHLLDSAAPAGAQA